jgi:hypothetical protein
MRTIRRNVKRKLGELGGELRIVTTTKNKQQKNNKTK